MSAGKARSVWGAVRGSMEAHSVVHLVTLAVYKVLQARRRIIQAEAYDLQAAVPVLLCNQRQVWEHLPAWAAPAPRDADRSSLLRGCPTVPLTQCVRVLKGMRGRLSVRSGIY